MDGHLPEFPRNPCSTATNFRWSNGLISPHSYGMTISSLEDLNTKTNIKLLVKYAVKDGTRDVYNEFIKWVESLKIEISDKDLKCKAKRLKTQIDSHKKDVRKALERQEFYEIDQYLKPIWKSYLPRLRHQSEYSDEDSICYCLAMDLKSQYEHKIKFKNYSKFSLMDLKHQLENFVKPLKLEMNIGYQKKRIFLDMGARKMKWILGESMTTNLIAPKRKRQHDDEKKEESNKIINKSKNEERQIFKKVATSETPPFLLSAILDFKKSCSDSEPNYFLKGPLEPVDILVKPMERTVQNQSSDYKSKDINPLFLNIKASFKMDDLIDSVSNFSDDNSFSSKVLACYLKSENSIQSTPDNKTLFSHFLNMKDPDVFKAFQKGFIEATAKLFDKDKR